MLASTYQILTVTGWVNISEIDHGVHTVQVGARTGKTVVRKIIELTNGGVAPTVKIFLSDGTSHHCTSDHKWLVYNKKSNKEQWIVVSNIDTKIHSMIQCVNQPEYIRMIDINSIEDAGDAQVYDVKVDISKQFLASSEDGAKNISHN